MARKQTRRTTSMQGGLYERVRQFADAHDIPFSQITEQALEAVLDGRLQLKPALVRTRIEKPVIVRAQRKGMTARQIWRNRPPVLSIVYPAATCACCVAPIPASTTEPIMVPWGRDNAMVRICEGCSAGGQAAAL